MRAFALFLALGLLAGCAAAPLPTYYRVAPAVAQPKPGPPATRLLLAVPPLRGSEPLTRTNITYRASELTLRHYQHHFWEEPPVEVAHRHLVEALKAANLFERVSTRRLALEADYLLRARLVNFEQVDRPQGRLAVAGLEWELVEVRTEALLAAGEAAAQVPVKGRADSAEGLAEAMSQALQEAVGKVTTEVAQAIRKL